MKIRLVVADDHVLLRTMLRTLLESQPDLSVVGEASNGREAVAVVRQLQPDVAILDIDMGELNGIQATRQICTEHLPTQVIIYSMHATRHHVQAALQAGALGYVLKDADAEDLITALRAVVAGQRFLSPKLVATVGEGFISR